MIVLLVLSTAGPTFSQDKPDDSDSANIGNRDINDPDRLPVDDDRPVLRMRSPV